MSNVSSTVLKLWPTIVFDYFAWMRKFAKNPEKYPIERRYDYLHRLAEKVAKSLKALIHVKGEEKLPNEASCLYSNHMSACDPLIYIATMKSPMTFLAKIEVKKIPFVNKCFEGIGGVYIDRDDLKSSLRSIMKIEKDLMLKEKHWLIFPEGTRNKDPYNLLLDFHYGSFKAPMKAKVPIVPCAIFGTHRLISRKHKLKKFPIYLEYGDPIYPNEYENLTSKEVAKIVQSRIQEMVSYHARQHDRSALKQVLGKRFSENF